MTTEKSILIFGTGQLQQSLIERCKLKGLYTVGIDPNSNAECRNLVDIFEVVEGNDYNTTLAIAKKYSVSGVITAATDKPLVMMARVARELSLPFFSEETAINSTDKFFLKQKFIEAGIPCAKGFVINNISELSALDISFPVIVKPRDNSGSRGVIYCKNLESSNQAIIEALQFTQKGNVLVEEFIEGKEYSVEGIHYNGEHHVIQITEKTTTDFPYNVELCHVQPADIAEEQWNLVKVLIEKVAQTLEFDNCGSHTEIKINSNGLFVIETSPRLGGDFISSKLVPLSTGINMENMLIDISINNMISENYFIPILNKYSGIKYFNFPMGIITHVEVLDHLNHISEIIDWNFDLKVGDSVNRISNSIERYGYVIVQVKNRKRLLDIFSIIGKISSLCIDNNIKKWEQ